MSKKMLKRSLALGALMAFVITGSAWASANQGTEYPPSPGPELGDVALDINGDGSGYEGNVYGIRATNDINVEVGNLSGTVEGTGDWTGAIEATENANISINSVTDLKVVGAVEAYGINVARKGTVTVEGNLDVTVTGGEWASGLEAYNGSNISVGNGTSTVELNVTASGDESSDSEWKVSSFGVFAAGQSVAEDDDHNEANGGSTVDINAAVLNISATSKHGDAYSIYAEDNSIIDITAKKASINGTIFVGNGSKVNINYDESMGSDKDTIFKANSERVSRDSAIVINGDIALDNKEVDSVVNVVLGRGSVFTGKIYEKNPSDIDAWSGVNIILHEGATWNLTDSSIFNYAHFGEGSTLVIEDGEKFRKDKGTVFALNGAVNGNSVNMLRVLDGAKIVIGNGKLGQTYNVVRGVGESSGFDWELKADNALWYVDWYRDYDAQDLALYGTIKANSSDALVESGIATNDNKEILNVVAKAEKNVNPTVDTIKELTSVESNLAPEQQQKAIAAVLQVGEAGGFTGNVVSVSKQVNGSVGARNSFTGPKHGGPRHRGGHGPSVTEDTNGGAIWAQYVHGKDKVDGIDMGGTQNAYESQFNGVVLGADFKQVGSYASGIAFNYGEGDSHSKKNVVQSDSEFDFWGVSYYGAVKKQDTNFIFDIGYSESDSDVEQKFGTSTITADPEASTWTAGVKVEKLIDKGTVQIVPYAGLRFMTIDTDDYEAKGGTTSEATYYSTERQNIWLLPVGVSLSQENVYDSGWIVTPKADLSYTWAMGDTDSSMTVNMPNVGSDTLGYTVMDDGSFMATVGLDAQKEDWTFGVAYSYQKGDSTRSDRWYVNARYSF